MNPISYAILKSLEIIPYLILAQLIIFLFDKFRITKRIRKLGKKNLIIFSILGILSTGPIYMWYEILKKLKEEGLEYRYILIFLYNRAIKIPLIPLMLYFLGFKLTLFINLSIFLFSFLYGYLVEKIILKL